MHIEFLSLRWKNFLSYGNKWTEIEFPKGFYAIRGSNGAGKSTIIDALFYGLYGKTYRDVKMDELINRTNDSDMLVEVKFKRNDDVYVIQRGRSPNILDISLNGQPLDLLSSKSLVQNEIDQILGMKQDLFRRVVILSIGLTKPFMTMTAQEQREFLSDVFNLGVFSKMTTEVKKRITDLKVEYKVSEALTNNLKTSSLTAAQTFQNMKETVENMKNHGDEEKQRLEGEKEKAKTNLAGWTKKLNEAKKKRTELEGMIPNPDTKKLDKLKEKLAQLRMTAKQLIENIEFFSSHNCCPTCGQKIDKKFKTDKLEELEADKAKVVAEGKGNSAKAKEIEALVTEQREKNEELNNLDKQIAELSYKEKAEKQRIKSLDEQLKNNETPVEIDLNKYEQDAKVAKQNWQNEENKFKRITSNLKIQKQLVDILSDNGVRGYYIDKYVTVVNQMVNNRLIEFGLDFEFVFNANDEATLKLKSDMVNYMSCSEGEKKRVDMAILLAFMEITKTLSGWDSNIIFFDELFDSSVDTENLAVIVNSVKEMVKNNKQCSFVITHRDPQNMDFDGMLEVTKPARFSQIKFIKDLKRCG